GPAAGPQDLRGMQGTLRRRRGRPGGPRSKTPGPRRHRALPGRRLPKLQLHRPAGRIALYEVLPIGREIRELIVGQANSAEIKKVARDLGMLTLREAGLSKVLEGVTTIEEVLRVTAE